MDGDLYTAILDEDVMDSISYFGQIPSNTVFQQDNGPKHTCKKAKEWSKNNNIQIISCPTQSPDLNPIEHVWRRLKEKVSKRPEVPKNLKELEEVLKEEWKKIDKRFINSLIESMPKRVEAVISCRGGSTKY